MADILPLEKRDMKCDYCKRKAVCNYQDVVVRYPVDTKGEYGEVELDTPFEIGQDINKHLCAKHEEDFLNGSLD